MAAKVRKLPRAATSEDCRSCGACCFPEFDYGGEGYVDLEQEDYDRIPAASRARLTVSSGRRDDAVYHSLRTRPCASVPSGRVCVALVGTVGERVRCSIYGIRPRACRAFEPGSKSCRQARLDAGVGDGR